MRVKRLRLKNIRGIEELDLLLSTGEDSSASTLLIGKNGTGKSSILRSIVLGLVDAFDANALLAEQFGSPFVSRGLKEGTISIEYVDDSGHTHERQQVITSTGSRLTASRANADRVRNGRRARSFSEVPLMVALGAGRSNEGTSASAYSAVDSTYMLFDYSGTFFDIELTLRRLSDYVGSKTYENVLRRIKEALGMREYDDIGFPRGGGVTVSGPGNTTAIPIRAWADGYRITLNWLLDVYAWAMLRQEEAIDDDGYVHGILLVDEIEQHLHPLMQRTIIQSVKGLFPKMHLIASTHSPLVVQGAEFCDIVALYRDESTVYTNTLPEYSLYSIEDIFTAEELFDTPPHSEKMDALRQRYRELREKTPRLHSDEDELREIGRQLLTQRALPNED